MFPVRWQGDVLRVAYSANPENILELNLSNYKLKGDELEGLHPQLRHSLRHLNLAFNSIQRISVVSKFQFLTYLNIMHNQLSSLDGIESLECLEVLQCSHNEISDLMPLSHLKHLKEISLDRNALASFKQLEHLKKLKELSTVLLTRNPCNKQTSQAETRILQELSDLQVINGKVVTESMRQKARKRERSIEHSKQLDSLRNLDSQLDSHSREYLRESGASGYGKRISNQNGGKFNYPKRKLKQRQTSSNIVPETADDTDILECNDNTLLDNDNLIVTSKQAESVVSGHNYNTTKALRENESPPWWDQPDTTSAIENVSRESKYVNEREHSAVSLVENKSMGLKNLKSSEESCDNTLNQQNSNLHVDTRWDMENKRNDGISDYTTSEHHGSSEYTTSEHHGSSEYTTSKNNESPERRKSTKQRNRSDGKEMVIKYPKSGTIAVSIFRDGTAQAKWPNSSLAVSINRTESGWTSYGCASNGKVILSFDERLSGCINYDSGKTYLTVTPQGLGMIQNRKGQLIETFTLGQTFHKTYRLKVTRNLGVEFTLGSPTTPSSLQIFFACQSIRYLLQHGSNPCSPELQSRASQTWEGLDRIRRRKVSKRPFRLPSIFPPAPKSNTKSSQYELGQRKTSRQGNQTLQVGNETPRLDDDGTLEDWQRFERIAIRPCATPPIPATTHNFISNTEPVFQRQSTSTLIQTSEDRHQDSSNSTYVKPVQELNDLASVLQRAHELLAKAPKSSRSESARSLKSRRHRKSSRSTQSARSKQRSGKKVVKGMRKNQRLTPRDQHWRDFDTAFRNKVKDQEPTIDAVNKLLDSIQLGSR